MKIPKTTRSYLILVNEPKIQREISEKGFDNALFIQEAEISDDIISEIAETGKSVVLMRYQNSRDIEGQLRDRLEEQSIMVMNNSSCVFSQTISLEEYALGIPDIKTLEEELDLFGMILHEGYTDFCGNCHKPLDKNDKYCRCCGTKRGEGAFEPFRNMMQCLYGPPYAVRYKCGNCGNEWNENGLGDPEDKFCPVCGTPISKDDMTGKIEADIPSPEEQMRIDELGLSAKTIKFLKENYIETVGDLTYCTENEVLEYCGGDKECVEEIIGKLEDLGLELLLI